MPNKMAREPKAATFQTDPVADTAAPSVRPDKKTKIAMVRTLLGRDEGATLSKVLSV